VVCGRKGIDVVKVPNYACLLLAMDMDRTRALECGKCVCLLIMSVNFYDKIAEKKEILSKEVSDQLLEWAKESWNMATALLREQGKRSVDDLLHSLVEPFFLFERAISAQLFSNPATVTAEQQKELTLRKSSDTILYNQVLQDFLRLREGDPVPSVLLEGFVGAFHRCQMILDTADDLLDLHDDLFVQATPLLIRLLWHSPQIVTSHNNNNDNNDKKTKPSYEHLKQLVMESGVYEEQLKMRANLIEESFVPLPDEWQWLHEALLGRKEDASKHRKDLEQKIKFVQQV